MSPPPRIRLAEIAVISGAMVVGRADWRTAEHDAQLAELEQLLERLDGVGGPWIIDAPSWHLLVGELVGYAGAVRRVRAPDGATSETRDDIEWRQGFLRAAAERCLGRLSQQAARAFLAPAISTTGG